MPSGNVELKELWPMSSVLSSVSSKMAGWRIPSKAFPLRFKCSKLVKYRISAGIAPERLRRERLRDVIWDVSGLHLMPDQEHHAGSWRVGLEKVGVGSQSWKVE